MSRRTFKKRMWDEVVSQLTEKSGDRIDSEDEETTDRRRNEIVTENYQYHALKDDTQSLRLLILLPGTREDDIACQLYETRLDKCVGSYEALSYLWGDQREKTPIQVNNSTLWIGINLRTALFNLRQPDKQRTIWIDAICIDQNNIKERNKQVPIIGHIYRGASQTVVWLGKGLKKATPAAFAMLQDLAAESTTLFRATSPTNDSHDKEDYVHIGDCPESFLEINEAPSPLFDRYQNDETILHLIGAAWWHRVWTIQEIILASHAIIMAGRHTLDWGHFRSGLNYGFSIGIWTPVIMGIVHDPVAIPYLSLQTLQRKRQMFSPTKPVQNLLAVLIYCRYRLATDARDKVYALLGLVSPYNDIGSEIQAAHPPALSIVPDYDSPVSDVFVNTTKQIILQTGSLDVLGCCAYSANTRPSYQLPSWVPDWSVTAAVAKPLMYDALGQPRVTHASRHSNAVARFVGVGGTTLVLEGYEITQLSALAPPLNKVEYGAESVINPERPLGDGLRVLLTRFGNLRAVLVSIYEILVSLVQHLSIYADWEAFAGGNHPTNPVVLSSSITPDTSQPGRGSTTNSITSLVRKINETLVLAPDEEEPTDPLAVYWQTLCIGTYTTPPPNRKRKIIMQQHFYAWRANLKPIHDLYQWHADRMLKPLAFVDFVRRTWSGLEEFTRVVEGAYERRMARGENGYLCLVPERAQEGDKLMLVKGGRVPLVMRQEEGENHWRLVGEAYVHGIMDGECWDQTKCREIEVK